MTLIEDLAATNDLALAVTSALEQVLGVDVILAVGVPQQVAPGTDVLPEGANRSVSLALAGALDGEIGLIVSDAFATMLEAHAPDEMLTSATAPALEAGAAAMGALGANTLDGGDVQHGRVTEVSVDQLTTADGSGTLVYPLLQNDERVACLVIRLAPAEETATSVARHEYAVLGEGAPGFGGSRPLAILNDVEMGVTAELGRRRMTVRDLLALTPGSVIELDRAAGTPVDVLVNGTLIARGEVVVIDEEFGIRIAEIVAAEPMGAA
jgi:flagellar motor switch protein FliN/FliY